jgi:hypothetical protein
VKAIRRDVGSDVQFVLTDVEPDRREGVLKLAFGEADGEYVRSFPADAAHLDPAWANFAANAELMVSQAAGLAPAAWRAALRLFLERVAGEDVDWWLAGSGALAVRGLEVEPRDLDVVVDARGARRLADLFADVLVEPLVPVTDWFCEWWCRAFPGARLEWLGGVLPSADDPEPSDFGPTAVRRLETVTWEGASVRVPPLDLQLAVSERRGLTERAGKIREVMLR